MNRPLSTVSSRSSTTANRRQPIFTDDPLSQQTLLIRISVPHLNITKSLRCHPSVTIWTVKLNLLEKLPNPLWDGLNYGLYRQQSEQQDARFLEDHKSLMEYFAYATAPSSPQSPQSTNAVNTLQDPSSVPQLDFIPKTTNPLINLSTSVSTSKDLIKARGKLMQAVLKGDEDEIRRRISVKGIDPNFVYSNNSLQCQSITVVDLSYLKKISEWTEGSEVEMEGLTPLVVAVLRQDVTGIKALIGMGAFINYRPSISLQLTELEITEGKSAVGEWPTCLHISAALGLSDALETLILLDPVRTASMCDSKNISPLIYAALGGNVQAFDILINSIIIQSLSANSNGAEAFESVINPLISSRDLLQRTCLHIACESLNVELVKMLIEYGADPNLSDSKGRTCLHSLASAHISFSSPPRPTRTNSKQDSETSGERMKKSLEIAHMLLLDRQMSVDVSVRDEDGQLAENVAHLSSNRQLGQFINQYQTRMKSVIQHSKGQSNQSDQFNQSDFVNTGGEVIARAREWYNALAQKYAHLGIRSNMKIQNSSQRQLPKTSHQVHLIPNIQHSQQNPYSRRRSRIDEDEEVEEADQLQEKHEIIDEVNDKMDIIAPPPPLPLTLSRDKMTITIPHPTKAPPPAPFQNHTRQQKSTETEPHDVKRMKSRDETKRMQLEMQSLVDDITQQIHSTNSLHHE